MPLRAFRDLRSLVTTFDTWKDAVNVLKGTQQLETILLAKPTKRSRRRLPFGRSTSSSPGRRGRRATEESGRSPPYSSSPPAVLVSYCPLV